MVQAKVTIDTSPLYEAAANILNRAGADWLKIAQKRVPVRKLDMRAQEPGARSEQFPVRLGGASGLTAAEARLRSEVISEGKALTFRRQVQRGGNVANRRLAGLFRFTAGPNKGQAPDFLIERRGRVLGVSRKNGGGTLKAGLELIPAQRDGSRVTVVLQNLVPYAYYMDEGFHHKGGGRVEGKHFMRQPLHNQIVPSLKDGKYTRG